MTVQDSPVALRTVLQVGGMTCGSCARRVERVLGKIDGVTAEVNYATGRVAVAHPEPVTVGALQAVIEKAGYTADLPAAPVPAPPEPPDPLRDRVRVCAVLTVPVVLLAMVPAWQFTHWQWASLALAAPVLVHGDPCGRQRDLVLLGLVRARRCRHPGHDRNAPMPRLGIQLRGRRPQHGERALGWGDRRLDGIAGQGEAHVRAGWVRRDPERGAEYDDEPCDLIRGDRAVELDGKRPAAPGRGGDGRGSRLDL